MSRIATIDPDQPGPAKALLEETKAQLGRIPNLYRTLAASPAALAGYLAFRKALQTGGLPARLREQIALLVAERNHCTYCVSAHMFRSGRLGITAEELVRNRQGTASDPATAAALRLTVAIVDRRGDVADADLDAARQAGWDDAAIGEIAAHVALNVFSNYVNHLARPELDFPLVEAGSHV